MKISLKYASGAGVIASLAPLAAKAQNDYNSGFSTTAATEKARRAYIPDE